MIIYFKEEGVVVLNLNYSITNLIFKNISVEKVYSFSNLAKTLKYY